MQLLLMTVGQTSLLRILQTTGIGEYKIILRAWEHQNRVAIILGTAKTLLKSCQQSDTSHFIISNYI